MKGFPLLGVTVIVILFAIIWWPLRQVMHGQAPVAPLDEPGAESDGSSGAASLRVYASAPIRKLRIDLLGQSVVEQSSPSEVEPIHQFSTINLSEGGVEFWVEAELDTETSARNRSALALELTPEGGDSKTITLWSDEKGAISDTALFLWESETAP